MKKKNSVSDFTSERNRHLVENFRKAIAAQSEISLEKAFHTASEAPAPRFWVSETRAAIVIGKMLAGDDPTVGMSVEKREMYRELFARFLALREVNPDAPVCELAFEVVNQPAPRTYMSCSRARTIIYQERKRLRMERSKA